MRRIVVSLLKGGVAKSETSVSLAHGLALAGQRVLLVDTDVQAQCNDMLGLEPEKGLAEVIAGWAEPMEALAEARENLWLLAGGVALAGVKMEIARREMAPEAVLDETLAEYEDHFDVMVMDTAPGWDTLLVNALFCAREVISPVSMEPVALKGLERFEERLEVIRKYNPDLELKWIVPTFVDGRVKKTAMIMDQLQERWGDRITDPIRYSVKLSEAPAFGRTIFEHDPNGPGSKGYAALVERVLGRKVKIKAKARPKAAPPGPGTGTGAKKARPEAVETPPPVPSAPEPEISPTTTAEVRSAPLEPVRETPPPAAVPADPPPPPKSAAQAEVQAEARPQAGVETVTGPEAADPQPEIIRDEETGPEAASADDREQADRVMERVKETVREAIRQVPREILTNTQPAPAPVADDRRPASPSSESASLNRIDQPGRAEPGQARPGEDFRAAAAEQTTREPAPVKPAPALTRPEEAVPPVATTGFARPIRDALSEAAPAPRTEPQQEARPQPSPRPQPEQAPETFVRRTPPPEPGRQPAKANPFSQAERLPVGESKAADHSPSDFSWFATDPPPDDSRFDIPIIPTSSNHGRMDPQPVDRVVSRTAHPSRPEIDRSDGPDPDREDRRPPAPESARKAPRVSQLLQRLKDVSPEDAIRKQHPEAWLIAQREAERYHRQTAPPKEKKDGTRALRDRLVRVAGLRRRMKGDNGAA